MNKTIENNEYRYRFIKLVDLILYKTKKIIRKESHLINKIKFINIKEHRIENVANYFSKSINNLNKFISLVEYLLSLSEKNSREDDGSILFFYLYYYQRN